MGPETELDPRKGRSEGLSSKGVLLSYEQCQDVGRSSRGKPTRKDDMLNLKEDLRDVSFGRYRSSSCKNAPSRPVGPGGNIELKRGSVYQSSREVSKMKKKVSLEGRRRSETLRRSESTFSSNTGVKNQAERSSPLSWNSDSKKAASVSKSRVEDDYFEICLDSNNGEKHSSESIGEAPSVDTNCRRNKKVGPRKSGNEPLEKAKSFTLHKSLSAKVGMHQQLPSLPEGNHYSRTNSKARFSPIRKMFDPFMKSKSLRSPLSDTMEACKAKGSNCGTADTKKNKTSWKSMLDDFSKSPKPEVSPQSVTLERQHSLVAGSPVHLHGCLKLENKDGMPFFEFSLKCPEEVFVAKTWKADDGVNWVYTFHSIESRKRSNAGAWGSNDTSKESSMVGQMQVSCYICSELRHDGALVNSVATEFVLYDITRARKSVAHAQEFANSSSPDANEPAKEPGRSSKLYPAKVSPQTKQVVEDREMDSSYLYPWSPAFLHPSLEIAATVIQVPFKKRESLKKLPKTEGKGTILDSTSPGKVKVVIPSGNHGMRSDESQCPSSLLDRWRLGGRCDCGGWDMACPLVVFGNPDLPGTEDSLELFVQGSKEDTPALTLTPIQEGEYTVDFHAQLSTLQALSICVAILHSAEASTCVGQERSMQLPQCNSLKTLLEEEVKILIGAVTEDDRMKATRTRREIPASFALNPPFSSNIGRV